MYRTEVRFNTIYVLESLPSGDAKTGQALYDDIVFPLTRDLEGLHTEFVAVPDRARLDATFDRIAEGARHANQLPSLHLEAHGSEDGIMLADGIDVPWRSVTGALARINEACGMNLVFVAIACMGWNLTHALMPASRAPVFMLVGPTRAMTGEALLRSTREFYRALVEHMDINNALEAMNPGLPFQQWPLRPATAEILFCRVFRHYIAEVSSFETSQKRENAIVADIVRHRGLDVMQAAMIRKDVRRGLADYPWWYEHMRTPFLMLDLFPHNRDRFGLAYERCMPSGA